MSNQRKLVCKKCGGAHLTFKCGRKNNNSNPFTKVDNKRKYKKKSLNNKFKTRNDNRNRNSRQFKVLLRNVPKSITDNDFYSVVNVHGTEFSSLMDYGISDFFILKKDHMKESCIVFVNFYDLEHAKYFISVMNGSYFDHVVISAEMSNK